MTFQPSYLEFCTNGGLDRRIKCFEKLYQSCTLCPHQCKIDRFKNSTGFCKSGEKARVASFSPHFGEEAPLVGRNGSGTIFFSACNLRCVYCQNFEISQLHEGAEIEDEQLAKIMLSLQNQGCHNINFVSPTHVILPILRALKTAIKLGLELPLVYNSGGYDSVESLKVLEGIFDIYMPDIKYYENKSGNELSEAENYPQISQLAIKEMYRQVGDLKLTSDGIAYRGLLVRHLVLPGYSEESKKIIDFIASVSKKTFFNIMPQYRPRYKAFECVKINKSLSMTEYNEVLEYAEKAGINIDQ
ncbi:MAG: 4Fe-4S cluster-binding domain-containing protein [Chloroflexia bacterium]|nr:4Fe-4S cluster-binding domain-containing protein [Chloroflexia bacterium]